MPTMTAHGKTLVGNSRRSFLESFGVPIRVCHGVGFADEAATIASVRLADRSGGRELELHGNMKVGTVHAEVLERLGIKIRVEDGRGGLADEGVTLASLRGGATVEASPAGTGTAIRFGAKGQMHCGTFRERFQGVAGVHIRTYLGFSKRPSATDQTIASARAEGATPMGTVELHGGMTVLEAEEAIGAAFGFAVQLVSADGQLLSNEASLASLPWSPRLPSPGVSDVEVEVVEIVSEKGSRRGSAGLKRALTQDVRISVVLRWNAAVDLDLHAFGIMKDGSFTHVDFADRGQAASAPFVTLDCDMGVGRTAGDNREEIGVHRLAAYRAILFATKIFGADSSERFSQYDGKVDVRVGGETLRVPFTASEPGAWAWIAAVVNDGGEPSVVNLNLVAAEAPDRARLLSGLLGEEPAVEVTATASPAAPATAKRGCALLLAAGIGGIVAIPTALAWFGWV